MRPAPFVALVTLCAGLACAGWVHHDVDLVEVDRHVADDAGYTLPLDATQIHIRDRSTSDVRSTWFRYTLPVEPLEELQAELLDDPQVTQYDSAVPPEDWPDLAALGFETPSWFTPTGTVFRREIPAMPGVDAPPSGRLWALTDAGHVYTWIWTYEGWRLQPDRPVVGDEPR